MPDNWSPKDHRAGPSKFFEDLTVGQKFVLPSRTQTSGLFAAFQAASGDNDPIHYDVEYCRRHGHRDMLAHGMQVLNQTAAGAGDFPAIVADALIGMIEISAQCLKPVYRGDTLYPLLEITELIPQNTTGVVIMQATVRNHEGTIVMRGVHKYLLRKREGSGT
jgi:acyl dehydratase